MQVAGIVTGLVFVVWISTLGIRFASTPPQTADNDNTSQLASVVEANNGSARLEVATTSNTGQNTSDTNGYSTFPGQTQ